MVAETDDGRSEIGAIVAIAAWPVRWLAIAGGPLLDTLAGTFGDLLLWGAWRTMAILAPVIAAVRPVFAAATSLPRLVIARLGLGTWFAFNR